MWLLIGQALREVLGDLKIPRDKRSLILFDRGSWEKVMPLMATLLTGNLPICFMPKDDVPKALKFYSYLTLSFEEEAPGFRVKIVKNTLLPCQGNSVFFTICPMTEADKTV